MDYLQSFIKMAIEGYSNSLIVVSRAGTGKTYSVLKELNDLGFKENINYIYSSNYSTPVQMFNLLNITNALSEPKLLVLDDTEQILGDRRLTSMLRGAVWGANGRRRVDYNSSSYLIKTKTISFEGRLIFLVNEFMKDKPIVKALANRGLVYSFDLTNKEILQVIKDKILPAEYKGISQEDRKKIFNHLNSLFCNNGNELTFRHIFHAFDFFLYDKDNWKKLFNQSLKVGIK